MVSIIIPYYGHEKFIQEALDSILKDNYKDKEIVIINDGSLDNGHEVIQKWIKNNKNKIIIKYKYRENRGLNYTLNELLSMASGKYIVMMGSDDFLIDDGIKQRVEFLENNPNLQAVFGDCIVVDENGKKIYDSLLFDYRPYKKEQFSSIKEIRKTLIGKFALAGPILMVKKDLYDKIGMYDENFVAEDLDFYLRSLYKNIIGFLDVKVAGYRIHSNNLSINNISSSMLRVLKDSQKAYIKNLKNYSLFEQVIMIRQIIKYYIREKLLYLRLKGLRKL